MRKGLFSAVVLAAVFMFGGIMESHAASRQSINRAARYYQKSLVDGIAAGLKLHNVTLSFSQRAELNKLAAEFVNNDLLPVLKQKGLLDEWVKAQNDPEIIALNAKAMKMSNIQELQTAMMKAETRLRKKYPGIVKMDSDAEFISKFQAFMQKVAAVLQK